LDRYIEDVLNDLGPRQYDESTLMQLLRAAGLLFAVFVVGTVGYYWLDGGKHTVVHYLYMTVITLTTIGFGEVVVVSGNQVRELFTIGLIVVGLGTTLYFFSTLTAFIVEGGLRRLLQFRRMNKRIQQLEDHFIIAGVGNTGEYVLEEMLRSNRSCVVIEKNEERIEQLIADGLEDFPFIIGDATSDDILEEAGIRRAKGLICSLGTDRDNLFVTVTAKSIRSEIRVVTRGEDPQSEQKFKMAGADSVIFTKVQGGLRMASEILRPQVTSFLDLMMRDHGSYRRVEEFGVPEDSPLVGLQIKNTQIRKQSDSLIIAVYDPQKEEYIFNPGADYVIKGGTELIILTLISDVDKIKQLIREGTS
jgi:voltage-gated potassium channel